MRRGKVTQGTRIPYGTLADASDELKKVYYAYGYMYDEDLPELPCPPYEYKEYVDPEEELHKKQMVGVVGEVLDGLTPREKKVLCLRFGIGLTQDYTLEEVGVTFELTKERIRQIEAHAMRKMKQPQRSDVLRQFIGYYQTTAQKKAERLAELARCEKERSAQKAKAKSAKLAQAWRLFENKLQKVKGNWEEIEPMLTDAPWIAHLEKARPKMYQELKYMVGDIWGDHAKRVWGMYQQLKGQT